VYTVPNTPKQEKQDCSKRQGKLGAGITDNQKRVRILVASDSNASEKQGAAIGPKQEGTCRGDSGVENPA
jgi:hypothetical protein